MKFPRFSGHFRLEHVCCKMFVNVFEMPDKCFDSGSKLSAGTSDFFAIWLWKACEKTALFVWHKFKLSTVILKHNVCKIACAKYHMCQTIFLTNTQATSKQIDCVKIEKTATLLLESWETHPICRTIAWQEFELLSSISENIDCYLFEKSRIQKWFLHNNL
jgi:hypothetical protein